jgi:hypothetical protein
MGAAGAHLQAGVDVDGPGGSNSGRGFPFGQGDSRLGRGGAAGREGPGGVEPDFSAVPASARQPELIGAETRTSVGEDGAVIPAWNGSAPAANAPERCKFLRTIGSDGKLSDAGREAVPTHRCAAFGDPLPLSLRQQELVCLQRVHVSCPRYMRGTLLAEESAATEDEHRARVGVPWLMMAGLVMIALVGVIAIAGMAGFLPGTGGPAASPTEIAAVPTATPTDTPTLEPTSEPTPTPTPSPSRAATPSPTDTPVPTPTPTPPWPPGATASRMNLLTPCTDQANCYVYVVRSAAQNGSKVNDTLDGIARFFGVSLNQIYDMNPWARSGIKPGQQLKIPPPTR